MSEPTDPIDQAERSAAERALKAQMAGVVRNLFAAIRAAVEAQRRAKQAATQAESVSQLIDEQPDYNASRSDHKAAEAFNTNRTYINEAAAARVKLKVAA